MEQQNRSSTESLIRQRSNVAPQQKLVYALDIFAFLPVPRTDPVSTKRSLFASGVLFLIFFSYVGYGLYSFFTNNTPRVNTYTTTIDSSNQTVPEFAVNFFFGDPYQYVVNDSSLFYFQFQQCIRTNNLTEAKTCYNIPSKICRPDWMPQLSLDLLCPQINLNMSGLLYETKEYIYPTININLCDYKKAGNQCKDLTTLFQKTSGGRVLLFMKYQGPDVNLATNQNIEGVTFQSFQYFLVPFIYNRAEIVLQEQQYNFHPDLLTSFTTKVSSYITLSQQNFFFSNVTIYSDVNLFQITIRLFSDKLNADVVYNTIVQEISSWGALWGVLFALFAFYFMRYNANKFYGKNPSWDQFEERLKNLEKQNQEFEKNGRRSPLSLQYQQIPVNDHMDN